MGIVTTVLLPSITWWKVCLRSPNRFPRDVTIYKGNYAAASRMFSDFNWEEEFQEKAVEGKWQIFLHYYNTIIEKAVYSCRVPPLLEQNPNLNG